ncbi:MAG: porin [Pseudomonadota bacterium]
MQKKLIALAIAAAMTVPALAYAEVSISGQANMSIDNVNDGVAVGASASAWQLNSNQSRVVLKGSEDLGNGLSAMWQADARISFDTGTNTAGQFFNGNTYVGVKSNDFGTVMLGNLDTPYKTSTRKLDLFFDTAGDNRGSLGGLMSGHDARVGNVIAYASPDLSGFSVSAATVFGGENPVASSTKGTVLSLAGTYTMDNIYAALAYQSIKAGTAGTGDLGAGTGVAGAFGLNTLDDEATAFKVGGGYTMDQFTVNAVIEMPNEKVGAVTKVETKNTNWQIGGKFAVNSSDDVKLAYTHAGASDVGGVKQNDDATQFAVGYDHSMSKATSVYAHYVKTSANGTLPDPSVLSFGLKHAF